MALDPGDYLLLPLCLGSGPVAISGGPEAQDLGDSERLFRDPQTWVQPSQTLETVAFIYIFRVQL